MIKLADQVVDRNRTPFTLYGRALLFLAMGKNGQALADYADATKLDPERNSLRNFQEGNKLVELAESVEPSNEGGSQN